ncbi:intein C-terminal splicing region/intein N-terminal splicing region [Halopenitus malekzadehii]|uniref:DNA helicase n=1 Tax=Halopenitus malekzadehii TaxID=1267564 RepID=A0A1H6HRJ6_9EURY|nr:LAGLIDADG family homing endonuclease [Halopenitus malekzadehii]SEH36804.1 intein C-terminal splicing region/intein N-terminal splicing region [Halopenitus malekzadehii]
MAQAGNQDLTERFIQFYRNYYREAVGELAQRYPNEQRSLYIDYDDLYQFDRDLAEDFRSQPEQLREYAEEALRLYDLPADVSLGRAHVRIQNLPDSIDIRGIRVHDDHIGTLVSVQGIVRKATDVRPKITDAAFECQRCGTMTYIPQSDGGFQEPHECQGCERQGPFRVNFDQSEFVDSQKLRIQESPEGLRGGETPQAIDVNVVDDITGKVTPGDHVTAVGVLHIEQVEQGNEKSAIFDLYMDGVSITVEDEQFEDMDITSDDVEEIIELSNDPDVYDRMTDSIAPAIYGYEEEKLAMVLQLFSGVTKHLPDGSRIRGDLHMLLIGDPGTGKCLDGDTRVTLGDGRERPIREVVEDNLQDPKPIDDGVFDTVDFEVPTLGSDGTIGSASATKVWKREAPETMYRIETASGHELDVTPSHPLFVQPDVGTHEPRRAEELDVGDHVAVAPRTVTDGGTKATDTTGAGGFTHAVRWDRIESIGTVEPEDDWVYDLEIAGTHNYVSNGVISHNSQMISYVENIAPRSVYTSGKGSSAAGLCVTGDTTIHTAEGFVPIRDLASEYHPNPVDTETSREADYDLYTFDRESGAVELAESSHVWRMPEKPCRRIETAHGKDVEASVNTPVLVCDADGIGWRDISDVDPGDHVAVPKYTDVERSTPPVREYVEFTEEKLKPTTAAIEFLRTRLREEFGTLRAAAAELNLTEDVIYDTLSNRHLSLETLETIVNAIDADIDDVDVDRAMLRHGDGVAIPEKFDADLLYLIGLVFGDGDVMVSRRDENRGHVRLSNSDEELLEHAAEIIEAKFDKSVDVERQDDRVPYIRLHSATVARFFSNVGVESPKNDVSLDPGLTTAEHADAFLQGLFDADGSVCGRDDGGSSVQFSTVCRDLAEQVQLMLETYGVRARTRDRDRRGTYERADGHEIESMSIQTHLAIYGKELDVFADRIGFRSTAKSTALDGIVRDAPRRGERLPIGDALARADGGTSAYWQNLNRGNDPSRDRALSIVDDLDLGDVGPVVAEVAEANLVWDEVVAAENTGKKEVFDLTVPDTHNFLANGLVTHNTAAAVRDDFGEGQQWSLEAGALVLADQGIAAIDELDKMRCVTGDTLIHLGDGRTTRVREFAREVADDGSIEALPNGRTIRDVGATAWTMTNDGNLVRRPITAVHEYEAPDERTRVTLESGESVTTTDDHPFFVFEDGERIERSAAELAEGDWVYVPRELPTAVSDGGTAVCSTSVDPPTNADGMSPAFAAVLGYLSGDGNVFYDRSQGRYGIRFTNTDAELLDDFEAACRRVFDAEPVRHPSERRERGPDRDPQETVYVHGKSAADAVLDAGMCLETYDGKSFPDDVSTGNRAAKAAFVRAMADSEGHVDTNAGNVRIASASYELLVGVKSLLLEFGVSAQIQTKPKRNNRLPVYHLTITDADSLESFGQHIGFTATRKDDALTTVRRAASGDRTILDVIPNRGDQLRRLRESLRLYQSECGINGTTYCNFENGDANVSIHRARRILDRFERRRRTAERDLDGLESDVSWNVLTDIKDRYHVSQRELAEGIQYPQQRVSANWGDDESLRTDIATRLATIVEEVAETDLGELRSLVNGDVKWRRVTDVTTVTEHGDDDRINVLQQELAGLIGGEVSTAEDRARELCRRPFDAGTWTELRTELEAFGVSMASIARDIGVASSTVSRWFSGAVTTDRFDEVRESAADRIETHRCEIRSVLTEIEERRRPKVYDLTVEGTHNFLANGMVVHNSEDRSAMHEGLEQQKISISKAGINATLKARCSLLGAANPKYGRFDQYEPIGEQIDLEPALISRFDLIFTVTDQPDPEHDSRLARHILKTNYAGELNTQRTELTTSEFTQAEVDDVTEEVAPAIDADLLRKYIAYAKRNCYPTMTEEAKEVIEEFYVDLRSKGADEDAPVPVTARKLEALVRLAEASARVRLSDTVDRKDADRATDIVESCLKDIGVDPETGQFDADVVETGTSKSQRDRIKNLKTLIADIEEDYEEGAPVEEVIDRADEVGMDPSKAEDEIEKLRRKGEVYEPTQNHLRTT